MLIIDLHLLQYNFFSINNSKSERNPNNLQRFLFYYDTGSHFLKRIFHIARMIFISWFSIRIYYYHSVKYL